VYDCVVKKTATKKAKKIVAPPEQEPQFSVSLQLDKTILKGTGNTVLEALRAIPKPIKITTKSVLTVTKGDKTHSRALTIPLAKRLFYPAHQIYHARNLELLMK